MTTEKLKWVAIISMIINNIGIVFFPKIILLKFIGRISFPIFAFLIAEGYIHTKDIKKYILRLLILAIISEIPYDLAISEKHYYIDFMQQNAVITLWFGLLSIVLFDKLKKINRIVALLPVFSLALIAFFIRTDYSMFGVMMVFTFYYYKDNMKELIFYFVYINALMFLAYWANDNYRTNAKHFVQLTAPLAILILKKYNGEKGRSLKYLFYSIYPVHLLIIYFITTII